MPRSVRLTQYGPVENLALIEVPEPEPEPGQVLVRVVAAGTNPGEIAIREGALEKMFPTTFPSGQGTDFAGRVESVGEDVRGFAPGDEVLGWSDRRSAQSDFVAIESDHLIHKPLPLDWFRAGSLFVVATTAYAAVRAVNLNDGDVVGVSSAAGGVGSLAVQLARRRGARVLGIASDANADWLRSVGVEPVPYGDGLEARLRSLAPKGLDAFIDTHGDEYVELAIRLGVQPKRIDTIIGFAAAEKYGAKADGSAAAGDVETLVHMAELVAWGRIVMPVAAVYPFERLHDAYRELAKRKSSGKIVLSLAPEPREPVHPPKD